MIEIARQIAISLDGLGDHRRELKRKLCNACNSGRNGDRFSGYQEGTRSRGLADSSGFGRSKRALDVELDGPFDSRCEAATLS